MEEIMIYGLYISTLYDSIYIIYNINYLLPKYIRINLDMMTIE